MKLMKNLNDFSPEEGKNLIDSIDYLFSDMDGVLMLSNVLLPGSDVCIEKFRELGKKVAFVTNNTISTFDTIKEKLAQFGASDQEIVTPPLVAVNYLKSINCPPDIYCIGGHVLKDTLTKAGYNIIDIEFGELEESMPSLQQVCFKFLDEAKDVGAIVLDLDVNFKLMQAEGAILLLTKKPDMEFLCVATDDSGPIAENIEFIGNRFYVEAIERISKEHCTVLGKPSIKLKEFLRKKFDVKESNKVLFVGDALTTDIAFANKAEFQSLVVLSGQTKLDDITNWKKDDELRPDYYVESLGKLYELIKQWGL